MIEVSDIINAYETKRITSKNPSPVYLFVIVNSKNFSTDRKTRISLSERRTILSEAWRELDYLEKSKYVQAATQLGYVSRIPINKVERNSADLIARLKVLRAARIAARQSS